MIVDAGTQRFEVRITSNEQKNAFVRFRYEPPASTAGNWTGFLAEVSYSTRTVCRFCNFSTGLGLNPFFHCDVPARFLIDFAVVSTFSQAQNLNGIWKGKLVMELGGCFPVYNIELQITINGTRITGNSYHYSDTSNYVKEVFEGVFDSTTRSMTIEEQRVATFTFRTGLHPLYQKYVCSPSTPTERNISPGFLDRKDHG